MSLEVANVLHHKWVRTFLAGVSTLATTLFAYFRLIESNRLVIERVEIPIENLPPDLDGFTIAQLSDFHYLPHTKLPLIQRAVAMTNALNPDLTVLTGDYVHDHLGPMFDLAKMLGKLTAKHGVYAILGNHDTGYYKPHIREVIRYGLTHHQIRLLVNEHVVLSNGLVLVGLDDFHNGRPNLEDSIVNAPADAPVIVLMHQPDVADFVARNPRAVLQLSGHTHGGQVRIPGIRPMYLPFFGKKYIQGLHRIDNLWLYVNRGIGLSFYGPLRINCPPEITLLTLRKTT